MIGVFESMVRLNPQRTCFTYVDENGAVDASSFRETRMYAAGIARLLRRRGVRRGCSVAVDLPNCPYYVLLLLAAAYGGFSLVTLNNRLSEAEKMARVLDLQRSRPGRVVMTIDEGNVEKLFDIVSREVTGAAARSSAATSSVFGSGGARGMRARTTFATRTTLAATEARSTRALGRASADEAGRRREEMARQDAVEAIIHFAERGAHVFDRSEVAVVMFTSGTTGRAKAVPLTWENLCGSAEVSNRVLNRRGAGIWQIALPLYHVGGLQMVVRSILNSNEFMLYRRFNASRVLSDAERKGVTHISVVDKMLQDMLDCPQAAVLSRYECILLGGGPLNAKTLERTLGLHARVFASYGMTETASQIANALVERGFTGGMRLLPGYTARIVDPGDNGFGRLAVRGPGLFGGYLNAQAVRTADGFFLTGDTAAIDENGLLFVKERTDDMFVSGGENVYPAEICEKLMQVSGVADAYVFGVPDDKWGRRPVGFVERAAGGANFVGSAAAGGVSRAVGVGAGAGAGARAHTGVRADAPIGSSAQLDSLSTSEFARYVSDRVAPKLSRVYQPERLFALEKFPRTGIGKVDRAALRKLYEQRIQIDRVNLYRIRLPFRKPFATAKGTLSYRESLLVEVIDHDGRIGLGECSAFPTDWYLPETIDQDLQVLRDELIPLVLNEVLLHPSQADGLMAACPAALKSPMARGAIEPALWDLYAKIVEKPLWQVIGGKAPADRSASVTGAARSAHVAASSHAGATSGSSASSSPVAVPSGAVVPMGTVAETLAGVQRCVDAGYSRVKLKVSPGQAYLVAKAVRERFPNLIITLDANQSFTESDLGELRSIGTCGVEWIEEPLDPRRVPATAPHDLFARLGRLQRQIKTPICLDESIRSASDLSRALAHRNLRCYALKVGKFGGIEPSLQFIRMAKARGIRVWVGGMYDTGICRRVSAALGTLPDVRDAGDIGAVSRYFDTDVTNPPYTVELGKVTLNRHGYECGLGCELDHAALAKVLIAQESFGK